MVSLRGIEPFLFQKQNRSYLAEASGLITEPLSTQVCFAIPPAGVRFPQTDQKTLRTCEPVLDRVPGAYYCSSSRLR